MAPKSKTKNNASPLHSSPTKRKTSAAGVFDYQAPRSVALSKNQNSQFNHSPPQVHTHNTPDKAIKRKLLSTTRSHVGSISSHTTPVKRAVTKRPQTTSQRISPAKQDSSSKKAKSSTARVLFGTTSALNIGSK